jgi:hypothetical protein
MPKRSGIFITDLHMGNENSLNTPMLKAGETQALNPLVRKPGKGVTK